MARILVIDDDCTVRLLLERYLTHGGHSVFEADNGKTGLQALHDFKPDLVITDIMMPEMDGLEILLEIRKSNQTLPIIAISGGMRDGSINFSEQAMLNGAQRVFEKPVGLDVLMNAVKDLLGDL